MNKGSAVSQVWVWSINTSATHVHTDANACVSYKHVTGMWCRESVGKHREHVETLSERVDELVHEDVLVLKLDVEGFEPSAFKSMAGLFDRHRCHCPHEHQTSSINGRMTNRCRPHHALNPSFQSLQTSNVWIFWHSISFRGFRQLEQRIQLH